MRVSSKTIKYFGIAVIILGLLYALLPYTVYRGWGWPNVLASIVNLIPNIHIEPQILYQWEAKALAHTFDVLLVAFLIVIGLIICSLFSKRKLLDKRIDIQMPSEQTIRDLVVAIQQLREELIKKNVGVVSDGPVREPAQPRVQK